MIANLSLLIKQHASSFPTDDAVICTGKSRYGHVTIHQQIGFQSLDLMIDRFASAFSARGIIKGSRALMLLQPGIQMIAGFFALIRLGAIPVVIDAGIGIRKFIHLANRSQIHFILCHPLIQWAIRWKIIPIFCPKSNIISIGKHYAETQKISHLAAEMKEEDSVAILFTSGSTGPAKGVVYTHRNFLSQIEMLKNTYQISPRGRDVTLLPAFMLFNPVLGRTTIIPKINFSKPSSLDPRIVVESITSNGASSSFGSPILWEKIAQFCLEKEIKLNSIRTIFLAGVSASTKILENIRTVAPNAKIFTPYGATEALPVCSISADEILSDEVRPLQENGAGTCLGYPVSGIEVKIIAVKNEKIDTLSSENILPLGHFGEIIVAGANVTAIYDQLPEATALAKIHDQDKIWHRMGDIGFLDQLGRVWYCGRKAEIVQSSDGEIYYPDCIEPLFLKDPTIERVALISIQHKNKIEPGIVVLPKKGHYPKFPWEKSKFTKKLKCITQMYPKTRNIKLFFFVKKLPVDPRHNSKIHRITLGKFFSK